MTKHKNDDWCVYEINPIDHGWEHLKSVKETLLNIISLGNGVVSKSDGSFSVQETMMFLTSWSSAQKAAKNAGWEGDFQLEPRVVWLPSDNDFTYAFVIKQNNNGTTYVVSPQSLPSLDDL